MSNEVNDNDFFMNKILFLILYYKLECIYNFFSRDI